MSFIVAPPLNLSKKVCSPYWDGLTINMKQIFT